MPRNLPEPCPREAAGGWALISRGPGVDMEETMVAKVLVLHFYLVKPAMPCPGNLPFHDWLIQAGNAAAVFQQDDEMSSIRNVVIDVMTNYQRQQQEQQAQPANMQQAMPTQPPAPLSLGQHVRPPISASTRPLQYAAPSAQAASHATTPASHATTHAACNAARAKAATPIGAASIA